MRKKVLAEKSAKQELNQFQFAEQTKLLFPIVSGERNDTHLSGALRLLNRISKPASDMLPDAGLFGIGSIVPLESSRQHLWGLSRVWCAACAYAGGAFWY